MLDNNVIIWNFLHYRKSITAESFIDGCSRLGIEVGEEYINQVSKHLTPKCMHAAYM